MITRAMARIGMTKAIGIATAVGGVAAGILIIILSLTGDEASAGVELWDNEGVVASGLSVEDAVSEASRKVGYPVRVPQSLPSGFSLKTVRADVGPIGPDQEGVVRDLSWVRSVTLQFKDETGQTIAIDQLAPEKAVQGFAGSVGIIAGVPRVEASLLEREEVTYLTWDSPTASYVARYHHPGETFPSTAEDILLAILKSMA